jgi:hypothetical protein
MILTLSQVLDLVGKLDDDPGPDTPAHRFRRYLEKNITTGGEVRDLVEECLRNHGDQYNRALQDLVNHVGRLLGFEVNYGRYAGVKGEVGFDGHWISPTGFHIVVETKSSEVFPIDTSVLLDYINKLISMKKIPSWDDVIGLYVIGRPSNKVHQLENTIVAEKRTEHLRVVSAESLITLLELTGDFDVTHRDVLAILKPSGPSVDPVVATLRRVVRPPDQEPEAKIGGPSKEEVRYWITPVAGDVEMDALAQVRRLVGEEKIYALGKNTPGRTRMQPGDFICFYATGTGVVAHAKVLTAPQRGEHPHIDSEHFPWIFRLAEETLYLDRPVILDADKRSELDAFRGKDPKKSWSWFVQTTREITPADFRRLTRLPEE